MRWRRVETASIGLENGKERVWAAWFIILGVGLGVFVWWDWRWFGSCCSVSFESRRHSGW